MQKPYSIREDATNKQRYAALNTAITEKVAEGLGQFLELQPAVRAVAEEESKRQPLNDSVKYSMRACFDSIKTSNKLGFVSHIADKLPLPPTLIALQGALNEYLQNDTVRVIQPPFEITEEQKENTWQGWVQLTLLDMDLTRRITQIDNNLTGHEARQQARALVFAKDLLTTEIFAQIDDSQKFTAEEKRQIHATLSQLRQAENDKIMAEFECEADALNEMTSIITKKKENTKHDLRALLTCTGAGIETPEMIETETGKKAIHAAVTLQLANMDVYLSNRVADAKDNTEHLNAQEVSRFSLNHACAKDRLHGLMDQWVEQMPESLDSQKDELQRQRNNMRQHTTQGQLYDVEYPLMLTQAYSEDYGTPAYLVLGEDFIHDMMDFYREKSRGYEFHTPCLMTGLALNDNIDPDKQEFNRNQLYAFAENAGRYWAIFNDMLDFSTLADSATFAKSSNDLLRDLRQPDGIRWTWPVISLFERSTPPERQYLYEGLRHDVAKGDFSKINALIARTGMVQDFERRTKISLQNSGTLLQEQCPNLPPAMKQMLEQTLMSYQYSRARRIKEATKEMKPKDIWESLKSLYPLPSAEELEREDLVLDNPESNTLANVLEKFPYKYAGILAQGKTTITDADSAPDGCINRFFTKYGYTGAQSYQKPDAMDIMDHMDEMVGMEQSINAASPSLLKLFLQAEYPVLFEKNFYSPPEVLHPPLHKKQLIEVKRDPESENTIITISANIASFMKVPVPDSNSFAVTSPQAALENQYRAFDRMIYAVLCELWRVPKDESGKYDRMAYERDLQYSHQRLAGGQWRSKSRNGLITVTCTPEFLQSKCGIQNGWESPEFVDRLKQLFVQAVAEQTQGLNFGKSSAGVNRIYR